MALEARCIVAERQAARGRPASPNIAVGARPASPGGRAIASVADAAAALRAPLPSEPGLRWQAAVHAAMHAPVRAPPPGWPAGVPPPRLLEATDSRRLVPTHGPSSAPAELPKPRMETVPNPNSNPNPTPNLTLNPSPNPNPNPNPNP